MTPMRSRPVAAVAAVLAAILLSGCGAPAADPPPGPGVDVGAYDPAQGNGLWLTTGAETVDLIVDAVDRGGPVRITGDFAELVQPDPNVDPVRGRAMTLEYRGDPTAFVARITAGDLDVEILVSEGVARVKGNAAYAAAQDAPEAAGEVVCTVGSDAVLAEWAPILDPSTLVRALIGSGAAHAQSPLDASDDPEATLDVIVGTEQAPAGVLTVGRFGPPLPQSFTAADTGGDGAFAFSEWGEPVDLAAAAESLPCP